MQVKQAERYKDYYIVIDDGIANNPMMVSKENFGYTGTKYIDSAICFEKMKEAKDWINKNSYTGMTSKYRTSKITYDYKESKRWCIVRKNKSK